MWKYPLLLTIIVGCFSTVEGQVGIKCYSCASMSNPKCSDENYGLESPDAFKCLGTCIKRRGKKDSIVEITRGCVGLSDDGCTNEMYNGIKVEACRCNTDYCNAAKSIQVTMATVITTLTTIVYLICQIIL